ncbi:MAG: ScpA family protein [Dermatophilaceae bacterium]
MAPEPGDPVAVEVSPEAPPDADNVADASSGRSLVTEAPSEWAAPGGVLTRRVPAVPFEVHLHQFDGPFDLLIGLIAKHRLDVTEIALATVTDEFLAHLRAQQSCSAHWDLSQTTDFLLVAATLLDLKSARLLPRRDGSEEDLELIEARDLLFARLLQYRAFKEVAGMFALRMATLGRAQPRQAGLEPRYAKLLPEVVLGVNPQRLARIAALAMVPKLPPTVALEHLHAARVSVREESRVVGEHLRRAGTATFAELVADATSRLVVVARFLVVLELYREGAVTFDQPESLGELCVRWTVSRDEPTDDDGAWEDRLAREYDEPTPAGGNAAAGEGVSDHD